MKLETLEVEGFGCVLKARVELGPGLNVLYGPNDLGKSTLAQAVRAALLLQHKSKEHERWKPWHADLVPTVRLAFVGDDGKHWRVKKTFDYGARGSSVLEWSPDGEHWSPDKKSREVDGELRKMLGWGVGEVGGRSGQKGFPRSFLATALLGEHADVEAVFGRDLGTDSDDGGRSRLTEALQTLAEDPRFKSVLLRASEKVDEAKTATGQWRRGRDSPMARIRERIEALQGDIEDLGKATQTSDEVLARFAELEAQRSECGAALALAEARVAALAAARAAGQRWHDASQRVVEAQTQLSSIADECARVRDLEDGVAALQQALVRAQTELADVNARELAAGDRARAAQAALRTASEGDDDVTCERQTHEHRVRTLELELAEIARSQREVAAAIEAASAAARLADERDAAARALDEVSARCTVLRDTVAALERELSDLDGIARTHAWQEAKVRLSEAERAAIDAAALRAQAARHRDAAARARASAGLDGFPSADELASLRALELALAKAEAGVSLGVAVRLHLETPLELHVASDGGPRRAAKTETSFTAERGLSLELGSVGRIDVAVGHEGARAELDAARARWRDQGEPTLVRCGVESVAALERAIAKGEAQRRTAEREELAATGAEARASALDAAAATLLDRRAELERHIAALAEVGDAVRARAESLDPGALARARGDATRALGDARARLQLAEGELAAQRGRALHADERATQAVAEAAAVRARLGGDPDALALRLARAHAEHEGELASERAAALQLQQRAARAIERATAESTHAAQALTSAIAAREAAAAEVASLRDRVAADRARLEEIARRCTPEHEASARAVVEAAQAVLAAIPEPDQLVAVDDLVAAQEELESLRARASEIGTELHKTEGMLEHVGGGVVKEKEQRTRAALDEAKRHETELYLEYEAWELLRDTLKKVEAVEGRHLGHALTQAIEKNLSAVTHGRYARFEMDRDLKTRGLQAAGAARPIEALSEGLKEQVATLVRLAIAQQLRSVVILDDQLAQTDVERVEFFRGLLREVANDVQIIVLTCRPLDYLYESELPPADRTCTANALVKAIDLAQAIERAPVVARG